MIFGKKKDEQKPLRISILTDTYLIDGLDRDGSSLAAAFDADPDDPTGGCLSLTDARLQPLGEIKSPPRNFNEWLMPSFDRVIAIWSDEPAAEDVLLEAWEDFQTPIKTLIYAGDFSIECILLSDEEDGPPDFMLHSFAPFEDAAITDLREKKPEVIHAKRGVINSALMHGFSIEK